MTYGFELYKENKNLRWAYSFRLMINYFAGLAINYNTISIKIMGMIILFQ